MQGKQQKEHRVEIQRPVTVRIEDFKENLNKVVAESELPPFMLEMLLGEYLSGVSRVARQEYMQDREEWDRVCIADKAQRAAEAANTAANNANGGGEIDG